MRRRLSNKVLLSLLALTVGALGYGITQRIRHAGSAASSSASVAATPTGWAVQQTPYAGAEVSGDADGIQAEARFAEPFGLARDPMGRVYISDAGANNRIRLRSADGSISSVAGSVEGFADGLNGVGKLHTPSGVALDAQGNLYIADTGNHAIRRLSPDGMLSTLAGNGQPGTQDGNGRQAQFNGPIAVVVDRQGRVLVADTYNDRIRMITPDGQVTTLAGGGSVGPGYRDGMGAMAEFDTPCGLALDRDGNLLIADTRNSAIRRLILSGPQTGLVSTLVGTPVSSAPEERTALLRRPMALAMTHDGFLYVLDDARGRVLQITPTGTILALGSKAAVQGVAPDIVMEGQLLRFRQASALLVDEGGGLIVADAARHTVTHLQPRAEPDQAPTPTAQAMRNPVPEAGAVAARAASMRWPVAPQRAQHEVVGTMGEVRGEYKGESRHHFHGGVDVQAAIGAPVLAVLSEKVASPLANWSFGELGEGLALDSMAYIHIRVGRDAQDKLIDPQRFIGLTDGHGKLNRIRVRRGTRFQVGEPLGSVNRMFHVHLSHTIAGAESNPQALGFIAFADHIAPKIDRITLLDTNGVTQGQMRNGRVQIAAGTSDLQIVVDAWDQVDGNARRRRLGLYQLGYQVLQANGSPVPGFETPRITLMFNRLPPERELVKLAYAEESGITVYGNATTRFLYLVSNRVRDGHAEKSTWSVANLARGDYVLRIFAADFAGNQALLGRDLPLTLL